MTEAAPHPERMFSESSPALARVRWNRRITADPDADVRHLTFDLDGLGYRYVEGQALGLLVPGPEGKPRLRYYSIASPRHGDEGDDRSVSVCIKRVIEPEGSPAIGCSHFLCDLEPGAVVGLVGPFGPFFPLPEDRSTPMILAAAGTGIAPFRGLLASMFSGQDWHAPVRVFHGVRSRGEALYRNELEAYLSRPSFRLGHAFSREQHAADGHPARVHHLMAGQARELVDLLENQSGRLYVCGVKGLDETVEAALSEGAADWPALRERMREEGRLRIATS